MKRVLKIIAAVLLLTGVLAAATPPDDLSRLTPLYLKRAAKSAEASSALTRYFASEGLPFPNGSYTTVFVGARINLDGTLSILHNGMTEEEQEKVREVCGEAEVSFEEAVGEHGIASAFVIRDGIQEYLVRLLEEKELDTFGLAPYAGGLIEVMLPQEYAAKIAPMVSQYVEEHWPEDTWRISYKVGRFVLY